jgi:hypothetical protein
MTFSSHATVDWQDFRSAAPCVAAPRPQGRTARILSALGLRAGEPPRVDDPWLSRYYRYLSANLRLPFTAFYPEPSSAEEMAEFRATVVELLDPARYVGDCVDGIFCKTRKGRYEINLPLVELWVPEHDVNYQAIDDYGHWLCNWR